MSIKKVSVGIVLYKNTKYLKKSIASLLDQKFKESSYLSPKISFEVLFFDNSPQQEATEYIKKNLLSVFNNPVCKFFPEKKLQAQLKNQNLLHSGGHNFLISKMASDSEAYICASNDMLYENDFIEKLSIESQKNSLYSSLCLWTVGADELDIKLFEHFAKMGLELPILDLFLVLPKDAMLVYIESPRPSIFLEVSF